MQLNQNMHNSSDQKPSASFDTIPNHSEHFGTLRNDSESFRTVLNRSERKENHVLTVRDTARKFEAAGVARTERSITKWCHRRSENDVPRLDAYFDPNERKYYITPQSVELAIAEEKAKAEKINVPSETFGTVRNDSTRESDAEEDASRSNADVLESKLRDLEIASRFKDKVIEHYEKQAKAFVLERQGYVEQLISSNRRLGELETENRFLQLGEPTANRMRKLEVKPEGPSSDAIPQ